MYFEIQGGFMVMETAVNTFVHCVITCIGVSCLLARVDIKVHEKDVTIHTVLPTTRRHIPARHK
jgi:hypothetical protein